MAPDTPWNAHPMRWPLRKKRTYLSVRSRSTVTKPCGDDDVDVWAWTPGSGRGSGGGAPGGGAPGGGLLLP
eukprot:366036-Chlamydomonas_euryale.AAC.1